VSAGPAARPRPGGAGGPTFDPFDPAFVESPYETYALLRDEDPVHWSELLWGWVVTRYDGVSRVLTEPTMSSDINKATPNPLSELEIAGLATRARASSTIVHLDDPDHARVRKLMAEPFRVREVSKLGPLIEARVEGALDRLHERHGDDLVELDLVAELNYPLPVEIFSEWLGMPEESNPQFREWTSWVARSRDPMSLEERDQLYDALDAMYDYLAAMAAEKRRSPTDDLLSYLVAAEEDGSVLSEDELMSQLITLYMAGHEPTAGLVGNAVLALLRQPDQLELLRADPSLLRNAVLEMLRYDGPNQFVRRISTEPMELGGREIPGGSVLYTGLASGNRDPRRWGPTADVVDVTRPDAKDHLQFGAGAHLCLGSHLARLQAERFLGAYLARLADLELAGEPVWSTRMFIRGLNSLPVRCRITAR
jgi:cytochrome P450